MVCILSAWEWGKLAELNSNKQRIWFAILCSLLLILIMLSIPSYQPFITIWKIKYILLISLIWWLVALLLVLFYPRSAMLWHKSKLLLLVFGILTILPFFCGMLALRQYHYTINHFTGSWWILYIMVQVWSSDSGAYIFGHTLGRYKLAPKVSPSKTWEGFIGGFITSIVISWFFIKYAPLETTPRKLLVCSIMTTLISVLGDLTESMFKREAGIKDSGYLIPGHGGILDRIDSLTAVVPIFACMMLLPIFNII